MHANEESAKSRSEKQSKRLTDNEIEQLGDLISPDENLLKAVRATWAGLYRESDYAGTVPNNLFREVFYHSFNQLYERGMRVKTLVSPDFPDKFIAFIAYEHGRTSENAGMKITPVVHFLFTDHSVGGRGISRYMLRKVLGVNKDEKFYYTHRIQKRRAADTALYYFDRRKAERYYVPGIARSQRAFIGGLSARDKARNQHIAVPHVEDGDQDE